MALVAHYAAFDACHMLLPRLIGLDQTGSQTKNVGYGGVLVNTMNLDHEHASHALEFTLKEYGFALKSSASAVALVEEHVAIAALPSSYLPRPRDLEPLRGCLVCFDLWHGFSALPVWATRSSPSAFLPKSAAFQ